MTLSSLSLLPLPQVKPAFQQGETLMSDIWLAITSLNGWLFRNWNTRWGLKLRPALLRTLQQYQLAALKERQEAAAAGTYRYSHFETRWDGDWGGLQTRATGVRGVVW